MVGPDVVILTKNYEFIRIDIPMINKAIKLKIKLTLGKMYGLAHELPSCPVYQSAQ